MQTLWQNLHHGARMLLNRSGFMLLGALTAICILLPTTLRARQQREQTPVIHIYKIVESESLTLHVFTPFGMDKKRAVAVLFHGGGFVWGEPGVMYGRARDYVAQGLVAIAAQYRLADRKTITPQEAVEDARDAIRWVRQHAVQLGIDPKRILAHGDSAGGHLATMAASSNDPSDRPNALVLWSPGLGAHSDQYFKELLLNRVQEKDISPYEQVRRRMPPMILVSGGKDVVTPDAEAHLYCQRVTQKGGRCEIHSYENLGHLLTRKLEPKAQYQGDFDGDPQAIRDAETKVRAFLRALQYVREPKRSNGK